MNIYKENAGSWLIVRYECLEGGEANALDALLEHLSIPFDAKSWRIDDNS